MAFIQGDSGPNTLTGGLDNDIIWGMDGNDTMTGGAGNDDLDGGAGVDTAVFSGTQLQYDYSMVLDSTTWRNEANYVAHTNLLVLDSFSGRDGDDFLLGTEFLKFSNGTVHWYDVPVTYTVSSSTSSLEGIGIYGGVMNDTMIGHAGDNNFIGGLGDDYIDGGTAGFDTAIYYAADTYVTMNPVAGGVTVDLGTGSASGAWGNDTLVNIDAVIGSFYNDVLVGGASANYLNGEAGEDILIGAQGDDTLDGWDGLDWVLYNGNASEYTMSGNASERHFEDNVGSNGYDTLLNVERVQFDNLGLAFDINGNAGDAARIIGVLLGGDYVQNEAIERIVINALDSGYTLEDFADLAIDTLYPQYTSAQLATLMYTNVVGFAPSQGDVNYLVDVMAQTSAAWLAVYAGDTVYNDDNIDLAGLTQYGVPFLPII
ncbi:hypothetical protein GHT07_09250 [Caenimonas koreensis DSM 17982]|uniref:Hemolysin-type calcium-binding repeat-containing protein n=1 Tax=Caenimonas koreensis DSM 17982 TaxID=1121255 RepID=A0A844B2G8_9BURK|nr:hypothetical protein [Caenimonas koreensis]MRD47462.1 hypothetical protein [Caenimonas koreensis DSM 17982]